MAGLLKHFDDTNFTKEIAQGITLVDFYADWCGPCRMMTPIIEQLAQEMTGRVVVAKLDIDSQQKTAQALQVTSIPTLILFKNGQEIKRIVGLKDKETLKKLLETVLT